MPRLIDKEPSVEAKPMKIIVAGMPRTATVSLHAALQELGYNPYHFLINEPDDRRRVWIEALEAKYMHKGRPYGLEEFQRLLGQYDSCLDLPGSMFWDDLYKAYPDAKVILTTRSIESWYLSMHKTILAYMDSKMVRFLRYVDHDKIGPDYTMVDLIFKIICNNDRGDGLRKAYIDHNERVRHTIPPSQLLEHKLGDGWEPLCKFLDLPVPDKPYPVSNNTVQLNDSLGQELSGDIWRVLKKWVGYSTPVLAIGLGMWLYRSRRPAL